ncbi:MAG: M48 family metallopeptidase [Treponema sp.]|nr:M48 family metallopeptidase [Treponema sp.]
MDYTNIFIIIFLLGTLSDFIIDQALEAGNFFYRRKHGTDIPAELEGLVEKEKLEKTVAYKNARYFLWIPRITIKTVLSLVLLLSGFYVWLYMFFWNWTGNFYLTVLLFSLVSSIPAAVIDLPFELYREFKIEKDFGFSKMTLGMWIMDSIKELIVSLVLMVPLLCAAVFLLSHLSTWWWLLLGVFYLAFVFLASYIYPVLIAPLFNKFTPLEEGELKDALVKLMQECGFHAKSVFVMDASKRSGHSNAYFTGLGKNKRIVLYDTLIQQLSVEEIVAVLAHELGHYKHKHILKKYCIMIPMVFVVLFAISLLINNPSLYQGFGMLNGSEGLLISEHFKFLGAFLVPVIFGDWLWVVSLISNAASRHDEFQADAFSARLCGSGEPLISALIKLNKENLSELTPPKIYCIFNYDHPPLLERIAAIRNKNEKGGK